ncbi:hydrogenase expression/formation protein [Roseateles puraquae]|uniref:Hydrogenase expression/formation protein n=1 Tax=Roseateles puraquae TaxID=431059 RepID=A0A254N3S3_9BURK|nr:hydrogenase expression/formation protein [Roseateles puraquae]MDG0854345.1 hydrogenase expression/formation protein [Roseateles puraquae]OWR00750.1 hydrogenase expression/formation protein [Roseateles puraquae]RTL46783.1 MAG: hydrogenase expression/formation protein [Burkholderiales bacterium]
MKDFPIPVRSIGPGSQVEDEVLDYMPMPQGMETFRAPLLPEPEQLAGRHRAHAALRDALAQLEVVCRGGGNRHVDLAGLDADDLALVNQVLGEGEVSAVVHAAGDAALGVQVQEAVFAGVWRVVTTAQGRVVSDIIELGHIPEVLKLAARQDVDPVVPRWQGGLPPNVQNAPALLAEIEDQWRLWRPGQPAHVVNLTLLPMSVEDIGFLDHHLGTGRVLILSRGYGNCRITNTHRPNTWRVVYYNSQDVVILNSVEISELPEVAQAAAEDLEDSLERLKEVLAWVEQA